MLAGPIRVVHCLARARTALAKRPRPRLPAVRITIQDYTPEWPARFAAERARLAPLLPSEAIVEHIGSTSVPGLAAKDIVDIMIGLPDFDAQAAEIVPRIVDLGFVYRPKYEDVMPFRRYFFRSENNEHRTQIHMVGTGTPFWSDHLLFRDYLRKNPTSRTDYEALKRELVTHEWTGFNEYAGAKDNFIAATMVQARASAET